RRRAAPMLPRSAPATAGRRGDLPATPERPRRPPARVPRGVFPAHAPAGPHAGRDRSRPSVPVHRQPFGVPPRVLALARFVWLTSGLALDHSRPDADATLRAGAGGCGPACLHAAGGRDPPSPAPPLPWLRHHLEPPHSRHTRPRHPTPAPPHPGSPGPHRAAPARAAAGP